MIKATHSDYQLLIQILSTAFNQNQSVNYIVRQDRKRQKRIENLIAYSLKVCAEFGEVFLSDDRKACALIVYPDKKKTTFPSILWDINLILSCTGIGNIGKILNREAKIKQRHPLTPFTHLWYIGVLPHEQGKGIGTRLLEEVIQWSAAQNRPLYLETSSESNLPFYRKAGFEIFDQLELSYRLYFLTNQDWQNASEQLFPLGKAAEAATGLSS